VQDSLGSHAVFSDRQEPQLHQHLLHSLEARRVVLRETSADQTLQRGVRYGCRMAVTNRLGRGFRRIACKRPLTGEHFIQHRSKTKHVRAGIRSLPMNYFRGEIWGQILNTGLRGQQADTRGGKQYHGRRHRSVGKTLCVNLSQGVT